MARKLFLTESGFFVVTNDVSEDYNGDKYDHIDYGKFLERERDDSDINYELTDLLNTAWPPQSFPFKYRKFNNKLGSLPQSADIPGYTALFGYKPIADVDYPLILQKLGYTIEKDIRDVYVEFNAEGEVSYFDKDKKQIPEDDDYLNVNAYIQSNKLFLNFNMPKFILKNEDYQRYQQISEQLQNNPTYLLDLNERDQNLYWTIKYFQSKQRRYLLSLTHETQHQKNSLLKERRQLKKDASVLSCEDIYKINVEDERSAKFSEILFAVNRYLQTGKDDLLKVCKDNNPWLRSALDGKSEMEKKAILCDHHFLLNECLSYWNTAFSDSYNKQFADNCLCDAQSYLLLPEDVNHKEFNKQRSLFYKFEVYNPVTGKMEHKDFSELIDVDVNISDQAQIIIRESEKKRKDTRREINKIMNNSDNQYASVGLLAADMLRKKIKDTDTAEGCCLIGLQTQNVDSKTNGTSKQVTQENEEKEPVSAEKSQENKQLTNAESEEAGKAQENSRKATKTNIFVDENISDSAAISNVQNNAGSKDYAEPYRQFYQNIAKQEESKYSENENAPYYEATLTRKDNSELNIIATSENHVRFGAKDKDKKSKVPDYKDFNDLVLLAKESGKEISFGNIKSSEYKARLMLACLENNVKMKNIPNISELKDILPETKLRLKDKLKECTPANSEVNSENKETGKVSEINVCAQQVRKLNTIDR